MLNLFILNLFIFFLQASLILIIDKAVQRTWKGLFEDSTTPATLVQNRAIAIFDYRAESSEVKPLLRLFDCLIKPTCDFLTCDKELSLREGDIVTVLAEDDSGWWKGQLNKDIGLFPSNFTRPVSNYHRSAQRKIIILPFSFHKEGFIWRRGGYSLKSFCIALQSRWVIRFSYADQVREQVARRALVVPDIGNIALFWLPIVMIPVVCGMF